MLEKAEISEIVDSFKSLVKIKPNKSKTEAQNFIRATNKHFNFLKKGYNTI